MYLTPVSIIKSVIKAFGIQQNEQNRKLLNDSIDNLHLPYAKIDELAKTTAECIEKLADDYKLGRTLYIHLDAFIKDYLLLISEAPYTTKESSFELIKITTQHITNFLKDIQFSKEILKQAIYPQQQAITLALKNIKIDNQKIQSHPDWKNKINTWKNGKHQPDFQSIKLISNQSGNSKSLKRTLLISRAFDYFFPLLEQYSLQAKNAPYEEYNKIEQQVNNILKMVWLKYKTPAHKKKCKQEIQQLEKTIDSKSYQEDFEYFIYFLKALWHVVYVGNLNIAHNFYKKAFETCLYRAGIAQEAIITQALVVASHQKKIDNVFLRQLRNAQITFGYDVPIKYENNNEKLKHEDVIQQWQIEKLKDDFYQVFPEKFLSPDVSYPKVKNRIGPVVYNKNEIPKPDYKHPDRTIKVGKWEKKIPQLVWFTQTNKIDIVKTLLEKSASIDKLSESNESAISMALEVASVMRPTQPNTSLFELISTYPHKEKTLNTRTNKKKLLPIISAVETGNPNIVKRILDMGADPNKLGSTDEVTALYTCLIYIDAIKSGNPGKYLSQSKKYNFPETIDSRKRYGIETMSLEGETELKISKLISENIKTYLSMGRLRQIARILLDNGANPNQKVIHPIKKGLTALAVAVEINEVKLVGKMINEYKGNINTTISHVADPTNKVDPIQIAKEFKSEQVLDLLINMQNR